ncbi:hypothetical protein, partial [Sinorhizobium meliloti]|uniref:hypothetical protein n=1 Tax=Rhizobium meliloti TaxID=382 RepID=UPI001AED05AC
QPPQPPSVGIAPQPAAATFSPQAGRRDKRRQLNPAFTAPFEGASGRSISLLPACGEKVPAGG